MFEIFAAAQIYFAALDFLKTFLHIYYHQRSQVSHILACPAVAIYTLYSEQRQNISAASSICTTFVHEIFRCTCGIYAFVYVHERAMTT